MTIIIKRRASRPLTIKGRSAHLLPFDHPAIKERRTLYPGMVRTAGEGGLWALKSGIYNRKIGGVVQVGEWAGLSIYTLTLEERATCPQTCEHLRSCYGNHMNFTPRMRPGPELEARLVAEVEVLDVRHVHGFAVRLHVLGDCYSPMYVELWAALQRQYSTLRIFGYTRRHDEGDPIAAALAAVDAEFGWDRFRMRRSGAQSARSTVVVECPHQKPPEAILCGQEMERKKNCAACALCWESEKQIAFIQH
jgi:hypothetical protein